MEDNMVSNEQLEKLYTAARNARAASDDTTALKRYEEINAMDPNSWEALFYLTVLKTNKVKNGDISYAALSVIECLPRVFELVKETISDEADQKNIVSEITDQCIKTALCLKSASNSYYEASKGWGSVNPIMAAASLEQNTQAKNESMLRIANIGNILTCCGNCIEAAFDMKDKFYQTSIVTCWKLMESFHFEHIKMCKLGVYDDASLQSFAEKIQQYDPSYELPKIKATAQRDYYIKIALLLLAALAVGCLFALPMWL